MKQDGIYRHFVVERREAAGWRVLKIKNKERRTRVVCIEDDSEYKQPDMIYNAGYN